MISVFVSGSSVPDSRPCRGHLPRSCGRHLNPTVSRSTQVLMLGEERVPVVLCYRKQHKLRTDGSLGLHIELSSLYLFLIHRHFLISPGSGKVRLRPLWLRMIIGCSTSISLLSPSWMDFSASHGHGCIKPHVLQRMSFMSFLLDAMFVESCLRQRS